MPGPPHRTSVYIDGFNFYYGEVRGTPWKWLNPVALFEKVLGYSRESSTAPRVEPSANDPDVNVRQDAY